MSVISILITLPVAAAVAMPVTSAPAAVTLCNGKVATIVGTTGDDIVRGTPDGEVIAGLGGDDAILAGGGDDVICGGDGADRLYGEEGDDRLFAGKAGRSGDRFLPDWLDGGPDDDHLELGRERTPPGRGVSGVVRFGTAVAGVVVDLAARSAVGDGSDTVIPRPGLRLIGTPDADILSGSELGEAIWGYGGSDTIRGYAGDDRLYGDDLTSTPDGTDGDRISGGPGKDVVVVRRGADVVRGGPGPDRVDASRGRDPVRAFGGSGDDHVWGSAAGDHIDAGVGVDEVRAGLGRDRCLRAERVTGCEDVGDPLLAQRRTAPRAPRDVDGPAFELDEPRRRGPPAEALLHEGRVLAERSASSAASSASSASSASRVVRRRVSS